MFMLFFGLILFAVGCFFVKKQARRNVLTGIGVVLVVADLARILLGLVGPVGMIFYGIVIAAFVSRQRLLAALTDAADALGKTAAGQDAKPASEELPGKEEETEEFR